MKQSRITQVSLLIASSLVFAACAPKATEQPAVAIPSPAAALPIEETRETTQIQQDICGKLPATAVSSLLGTTVGQPSVMMIGGTSGATRHICTYAKRDDMAINLLNMTVVFTKENKPEDFQAMWSAQKEDAQVLEDLGAEAYAKEVNNQPMVYLLTEDAQYWLQLAETSLSASQQLEKLKEAARMITK